MRPPQPASGRPLDQTGSLPASDPRKIGWLLLAKQVQSASLRYRCFHMARVLGQSGIESAYFTDVKGVSAAVAELDALIIVKRLDETVQRSAAIAARHGVPIYLDLCDDLLSDRYAKNPDGVNGMIFAAMAPVLAGITVASAAMADQVRAHMDRLCPGLEPVPVHVIPDIAETRTLYHLTEHFVGQTGAPDAPLAPPLPQAARPGHAQVLWFGNFGAPHSNFGIFSLAQVLPALAAVHRDISLELVVISNNVALFESLTEGCGFPTRYIAWSPDAVYDALEQADLVLSTSGTDAFSRLKSANRPLQALAAGVPVLSDLSPALAEFDGIIMIGQYEANLRRCLALDPVARHARLVAPAEPLLARYSPMALAGLWRQLLQRGPAALPPAAAAMATPRAHGRVMIVATPDTKAAMLLATLRSAHQAGLECEVLMPAAAAAKPKLRKALREAGVIPRVFATYDKLSASLLEGLDLLILATPEDQSNTKLAHLAKQAGLSMAALEAEPPLWSALIPEAVDTARLTLPSKAPTGRDAEWIFVVHPNNRGWILDAISREIGTRQLTDWNVAYNPRPLPQAKTYFFTHYSLFQGALQKSPDQLARAKSLVWYTHPRDNSPEHIAALLAAFERAHRVIFACSAHRDLWIGRGLPPEKTELVLGGADPVLFAGHDRGNGVIGLSSSFYERKNPDMLHALVAALPHRRFHLVGRGWRQYALFEALLAAPNFHYDEAIPYRDYPAAYQRFDVFLSMSKLEGGPIPLLEAMMENAVPVASRTGFAPDLIQHGQNGYLFDVDAPAAEVAALIEAAFENTADIRATVLDYDWDSFARRIAQLAQ